MLLAGRTRGSFVRDPNVQPNDIGRQQFFEYQSHGTHKDCFTYPRPEYLDDYFYVLTEGKWLFDLCTREYQQLYKRGQFPGFYGLWMDWEGHRWMLPYICKWYKKESGEDLPDWLGEEINVTFPCTITSNML